jgi:hypothetical protein
MTKAQIRHAEQAVDQFKAMLSATGRQHVGEKHFQELALLIEAAINSALLEENANYVAELEQVLQRMKRSGERFEEDASSAQIVSR